MTEWSHPSSGEGIEVRKLAWLSLFLMESSNRIYENHPVSQILPSLTSRCLRCQADHIWFPDETLISPKGTIIIRCVTPIQAKFMNYAWFLRKQRISVSSIM
jgi:hypothetical protein